VGSRFDLGIQLFLSLSNCLRPFSAFSLALLFSQPFLKPFF